MPHIYRPAYTRPIPPGAEKCTHRKRPAVRWRGRGGRIFLGVVCAGNPARCRVESAVWRISYTGADGQVRDEAGYTDRAATESLLAERVRTSARVSAGLLPGEALTARLTLTELLERWRRYMVAGKTTPAGAARQAQRARDVCDGVSAKRVADITPSRVMEWIGQRKRANRHKQKAFGSGTAANYIGSIKSFTRWCALVERSEPVDHLSGLKKTTDPTDTRRRRRALAPKELTRFLDTTRRSEAVIFGLAGLERHALYLLACSTGLRACELASLTPEYFTDNTIVIEVGAKNRQRHELPVPEDVMRVVQRVFPDATRNVAGGFLWPNRGPRTQAWWLRAAAMVRRDLAAAGIAPVAGGRVYDFHSLRGQFATDLDRAGVSLTRAQKLMRHSTPTLTARHYQRPEAEELAAEVAKLQRGRKRS